MLSAHVFRWANYAHQILLFAHARISGLVTSLLNGHQKVQGAGWSHRYINKHTSTKPQTHSSIGTLWNHNLPAAHQYTAIPSLIWCVTSVVKPTKPFSPTPLAVQSFQSGIMTLRTVLGNSSKQNSKLLTCSLYCTCQSNNLQLFALLP